MPQQPESVAEWLFYAKSHLLSAQRSAGPDILWAIPCFEAQQAAEKAIKAVLILSGIRPPWTHEIAELLQLLPPEVPRPAEVEESRALALYAAVTRYPGGRVRVSEQQYRGALRLAEAVVA
jgi:HEPN domain-containing protein